MKLYCPLSGISYGTDVGYGHGKAPHPVFYLPLKQLIQQNLDPYTMGKLTGQEVHLFGCALLHKLPVVWDVAVESSPAVDNIWKKHIEKLAACCLKFDSRLAEEMPKFHIDKHSKNLGNLKIYLESIDDTIRELHYGEDSVHKPTYITRNAEATILRMLRGSMSRKEKQETFPQMMAAWAADVASFPTEIITIAKDRNGTTTAIPCNEYWKDILIKLFKESDPINVLSTTITPADIDEIIEHCESHLEIGSLHSLSLMRRLREVKEILDEFRSPAPSASIKIRKAEKLTADLLSDYKDLAPINVDRPKVTIPENEPLRKDYPNTAAYLRAKIAWQRGY